MAYPITKMSSFTDEEINTLMHTDNLGMLKYALTLLEKEIPHVQKMYDNAVEDGEKTGDFHLSVAILRGTKAGLKDHGFHPRVGLMRLRELKREITEYLKSLPEVQPEVEKEIYGEPPVPSPAKAAAEQDAIEESMDRKAEKNDPVLREMIMMDKHLTEFEKELSDEEKFIDDEVFIAHELAIASQEHMLKQELVDNITEMFRMIATAAVFQN